MRRVAVAWFAAALLQLALVPAAADVERSFSFEGRHDVSDPERPRLAATVTYTEDGAAQEILRTDLETRRVDPGAPPGAAVLVTWYTGEDAETNPVNPMDFLMVRRIAANATLETDGSQAPHGNGPDQYVFVSTPLVRDP